MVSFVFYVVFCSKKKVEILFSIYILLRVSWITFIRYSHSQKITKLTVLKQSLRGSKAKTLNRIVKIGWGFVNHCLSFCHILYVIGLFVYDLTIASGYSFGIWYLHIFLPSDILKKWELAHKMQNEIHAFDQN